MPPTEPIYSTRDAIAACEVRAAPRVSIRHLGRLPGMARVRQPSSNLA